jgi:hypothetical protein
MLNKKFDMFKRCLIRRYKGKDKFLKNHEKWRQKSEKKAKSGFFCTKTGVEGTKPPRNLRSEK